MLIDTLFDDAPVSLPPFEAVSFNLGDMRPPHAVNKELPSKPTAETEPELTVKSKCHSVAQALLINVCKFKESGINFSPVSKMFIER